MVYADRHSFRLRNCHLYYDCRFDAIMKPLFISAFFGLIVCAVHYWLFTLVSYEFRPIIFGIYLYMLGFSIIFHLVLAQEKRPQRFVNYYMGFSGSKLMLSLLILVTYGSIDPNYLHPFSISFLIVYFTFTAFEITRLLKQLKN